MNVAPNFKQVLQRSFRSLKNAIAVIVENTDSEPAITKNIGIADSIAEQEDSIGIGGSLDHDFDASGTQRISGFFVSGSANFRVEVYINQGGGFNKKYTFFARQNNEIRYKFNDYFQLEDGHTMRLRKINEGVAQNIDSVFHYHEPS